MEPEWAQLKDEDLLQVRICDLKIDIKGSLLEEKVNFLYNELQSKNLNFSPRIYLGDEWFSPEGMIAIAIPFYLAHPRLIALEKKIMLEVEGEDQNYFLKLLRHEAGHCFDHAYQFSKRKKWKVHFGDPKKEYAPETYRPRPYSRSYVKNLNNWYAQAHPDEDFAETFAVWLDPESNWQHQYSNWKPATQKLTYMEELVQESTSLNIKGEVKGSLPYSITKTKTSLERYYQRRKKENAAEYPDFYDEDLKKIFNGSSLLSQSEHSAARFLRINQKIIIQGVSYWTGEKKYTVHSLVKKLIYRCETLELRLGKSENQTCLETSAYLATLVTHYLFTGKFKRTV